ncbi:uncharacterized protein LOC134437312 [Engraulis encrasicolus]|uniref:uncharacterized protein LOC134437312 n=1 Tax=Engraulis encrasicolus TaxID=184585 RepID=UPI002FD23455
MLLQIHILALMSPLLIKARTEAYCCCLRDHRTCNDVEEKECFAVVHTQIFYCCAREEDIMYVCREDHGMCKRSFMPAQNGVVDWKVSSPWMRKCGVCDFCCSSRLIGCNISLDVKMRLCRVEKTFPCIPECVGKEWCLSLDGESHAGSKECIPGCIFMCNRFQEFCADCSPDRFYCCCCCCCEMVQMSSTIRTQQNLHTLMMPLVLVFLLK